MSKRSQAPPTPSSILKDGTGEPSLKPTSTTTHSHYSLRNFQSNQPSATIPKPPRFSSNESADKSSEPFYMGKIVPIIAKLTANTFV
ncbi:uncharacterized protein BKA55DRAFT_378220 [Fusarium redolens]|uniref:Uncharacterized protein n=1 Tax=Fusarium redolens TaxID=48865 RepID=A0A9P9H4W4_FUSRE|nr:uncharacterized protein BKA55DRAFT_378220 [Fusarium redolens]KAH7250373.1 hypothetical protein BKA55DRAFT_378220 [Fusarium redolens]